MLVAPPEPRPDQLNPVMKKEDRVRKDDSKQGCARQSSGADITLNLNAAEARALQWWLKRRWTRQANIAVVAHFLVLLLLNRPRVLEAWLNQLCDYTAAEDVHQFRYLRDTLTARGLDRVNRRKLEPAK